MTRIVREMPYFERAVPARPMVDHLFDDRDALLAGDRRQKPVHLAVQLQRLHDLGSEHFQRTAVVVKLDAGRKRDDRVGDHRGQAAIEERIFPVLSPARDDVGAALLQDFDHPRNVARIVLQVAVGRHDVAAARVGEAGGKRGSLAEVSAEADDSQPRVCAAAAPPAGRTCRRCCRRRSREFRRDGRTPASTCVSSA